MEPSVRNHGATYAVPPKVQSCSPRFPGAVGSPGDVVRLHRPRDRLPAPIQYDSMLLCLWFAARSKRSRGVLARALEITGSNGSRDLGDT
ncbi:hypothetical protein GGTG_10228 [Gaeumannomyces tritici R3-111a-1]|uniref:Uncharacterized protein n=1 Tax=Gaeumannomyces tritici (strain R3-111a-1) TaxID=644352 RepID=J3P9Q1_GAET3|nr:hypothetical protein GGTG_10228 [Gaeumannomyces tritici R3-111a-1]EJT73387.1 hypothetical protein GGTG_10228 [Gaeumannomyces tritici R3-111a-1]